MSDLSRRGFFLTWLVGLLSCWLGRSQATAASPPLDSAPPKPGADARDACPSLPTTEGTFASSQSFTWRVAALPPSAGAAASPGSLGRTITVVPATAVSWNVNPPQRPR